MMMESSKGLALDLGTHTGWCTTGPSPADWLWGEEDFSIHRHESYGMRLLRFQRWLLKMVGPQATDPELALTQGVRWVVYEEVNFVGHAQAMKVLERMTGILIAMCEEYEIPYYGVPVGTLKKHATGKGNAGKPAMAEAFKEKILDKYPFPTYVLRNPGDNAVDAVWLAHYAITHLIPGGKLG